MRVSGVQLVAAFNALITYNIDRAATYLRNSSVNTGREVVIPCKCGEVAE